MWWLWLLAGLGIGAAMIAVSLLLGPVLQRRYDETLPPPIRHRDDCPQRAFVPLWAIGARGRTGLNTGWCIVLAPPEPCDLEGCDRLVTYATRGPGTAAAIAAGRAVGVVSKRRRLFCSPAHRDEAARPPKQPRELKPSYTPAAWMLEPARCPFPHKKAFGDRAAAELYFHDVLAADPRLEVYLCVCWRYHAGHPNWRQGDEPIDVTPPLDLGDTALGSIARITPPKEKK